MYKTNRYVKTTVVKCRRHRWAQRKARKIYQFKDFETNPRQPSFPKAASEGRAPKTSGVLAISFTVRNTLYATTSNHHRDIHRRRNISVSSHRATTPKGEGVNEIIPKSLQQRYQTKDNEKFEVTMTKLRPKNNENYVCNFKISITISTTR